MQPTVVGGGLPNDPLLKPVARIWLKPETQKVTFDVYDPRCEIAFNELFSQPRLTLTKSVQLPGGGYIDAGKNVQPWDPEFMNLLQEDFIQHNSFGANEFFSISKVPDSPNEFVISMKQLSKCSGLVKSDVETRPVSETCGRTMGIARDIVVKDIAHSSTHSGIFLGVCIVVEDTNGQQLTLPTARIIEVSTEKIVVTCAHVSGPNNQTQAVKSQSEVEMDPAEPVFKWLQQKYGKELIECTIWSMWKEDGKWYAVTRSRTQSNPSSRDNPDVTLVVDDATGNVLPTPKLGYCEHDGSPLGYLPADLLSFRYTTFSCQYDGPTDPKYYDFRRRFDEAAKLLQSSDQTNRVEGAHMIVKLVEDGAGVISSSPRTEWLGKPHYNIVYPPSQ